MYRGNGLAVPKITIGQALRVGDGWTTSDPTFVDRFGNRSSHIGKSPIGIDVDRNIIGVGWTTPPMTNSKVRPLEPVGIDVGHTENGKRITSGVGASILGGDDKVLQVSRTDRNAIGPSGRPGLAIGQREWIEGRIAFGTNGRVVHARLQWR